MSLIREVGEDSGLIVIPESHPVRLEKLWSGGGDYLFEKNKIYVCHSCFFFFFSGDAKTEMTQTHMTGGGIKREGFHLEWATAQEIINPKMGEVL